jgi:chaperonin GroES
VLTTALALLPLAIPIFWAEVRSDAGQKSSFAYSFCRSRGHNLETTEDAPLAIYRTGVIVPDTAKEKPQEGEVVAVGAGKLHEGKRIPMDVEVGDRILFGKYGGTEIKIEDEEYLILREDEVLGKMQRAAKAASGKR